MEKGSLTRHALKRMKQRCGFNSESAVTKALERGYTHSQTKGSLHRLLDREYLRYRTASQMRVYQGKVFIFTEELVLVTIINLPRRIAQNIKKYIKKEVNENVGELQFSLCATSDIQRSGDSTGN